MHKGQKLTPFRTPRVAFTAVVTAAIMFAFENQRNDGFMKTASDNAKEAFWLWAKQVGGAIEHMVLASLSMMWEMLMWLVFCQAQPLLRDRR